LNYETVTDVEKGLDHVVPLTPAPLLGLLSPRRLIPLYGTRVVVLPPSMLPIECIYHNYQTQIAFDQHPKHNI